MQRLYLRAQRQDRLVEAAEVAGRQLPDHLDAAGVGPDDGQRSRDAAGGPGLGVVLEQDQVGAWPVGAEHARHERGGAGPGRRRARSVGELGAQVDDRVGDARVDTGELDLPDVGARRLHGVVRLLQARCRRLKGGEVDGAVDRRQRRRVEASGRLDQRRQRELRDVVHRPGYGLDGGDVVPDLRQPGGQAPHRVAGARPGCRRPTLEGLERGPCPVGVAGHDLLLHLTDQRLRRQQRVACLQAAPREPPGSCHRHDDDHEQCQQQARGPR